MSVRSGPRARARAAVRASLVLLGVALLAATSRAEDAPDGPRRGRSPRGPEAGPMAALSQVLGRPTDRGITLSVASLVDLEASVEVGPVGGEKVRTPVRAVPAGKPTEIELTGLSPGTRYEYRLRMRQPGQPAFVEGAPGWFSTQRAAGAAFTFTVQGDSHPERSGRMWDAALYAQTLRNVAADAPDLHVLLGDDFSIDPLIGRGDVRASTVDAVYAHQRTFLGIVGRTAPLFLVNGNHEQAARYLLDGTPDSPAVLAGRARIAHFPLPAPDAFYGGDAEPVEHVGLVRDYYAWTWGDALFVVLDPYWHSSVAVDAEAGGERGGRKGGGKGRGGGAEGGRDLWDVTLGEAQYRWFQRTLAESRARHRFVFCHHVLGTGRGGIERAGLCEWGGRDERGRDTFAERRPGWDLPIHALMARHGVSIFFQGHDHLFARQTLDGVVYQTVPCPADPTYTAFNREAYRSGDVLPNSGHLRVRVEPESVRVEYVRGVRPQDAEALKAKNGDVAFSYEVAGRPAAGK